MNFFKKWYTYQKERFPVLKYGIYIFAIVFSTYCFTNWILINIHFKDTVSYLMGKPKPFMFEWNILISMFAVAFLQFLMVRIIDEFKDYDEDCKYRPYRPVPRGLITLKELKVLFIICAIMQIYITASISVKGIIYLILVWVFFAIMSKSFFMKKLLDKHILLEVTFDELLMPVLVIYLSSFVMYNMSRLFTSNYFYIYLFMTYFISWVVEIARKVRCKEDEEEGVKTYTAVFGIKKAVLILVILETILLILQTVLLGWNRIIITIIPYIIVNIINILFCKKQNKKFAKLTELSANIYIFLMYFSMALLVI